MCMAMEENQQNVISEHVVKLAQVIFPRCPTVCFLIHHHTMPLKTLFRYLMNHPEVIDRLADSYPIRRAAQLTAYLIHRSKEAGNKALDDFLRTSTTRQIKDQAENVGSRAQSFTRTFSQELRDGIRKMNEEIKKQK